MESQYIITFVHLIFTLPSAMARNIIFSFNKQNVLVSGCSRVGTVVASYSSGPRFESSHRQLLLNNHLMSTVWRKDEDKLKRPGIAHLLTNQNSLKITRNRNKKDLINNEYEDVVPGYDLVVIMINDNVGFA